MIGQHNVAKGGHVGAFLVSGLSFSTSSRRKLLEEGNLGAGRLATRRNERHRWADGWSVDGFRC